MQEKIEKKLLQLSYKAAKKGEVPVAALIVYENKIISASYNKRKKTNSVISHAEIECILKANRKIKDWRLENCDLYVTLKPCHMCREIIKESRIKNVYYYVENYKDINYKTNFLKIDKNNYKFKNLLTNFFEKIR